MSGEFVGTTAEEDKKQLADAEAKLWAWYLEWSQIARVAVTQRALLKQMGFVATRPSKPSEDEQEDGEGESDGPSTQPAIPVSPVNG